MDITWRNIKRILKLFYMHFLKWKNTWVTLILKGITGSRYEKLHLASAILFSLRWEESDDSF